jgi:hypothetical protein
LAAKSEEVIKVTGDTMDAPTPEPVKKTRKSRASEPAPDDTKAESAEEETLQVADVDEPQADEDGDTDETSAATTEVERQKVEEHRTQTHAAAKPAEQSGAVKDKIPKGKGNAGLMRFRRRRR